MAVYCAKCGTMVDPGAKFCQSCGAPAPQPVQAAAPPSYTPPPPPQNQWAPPPPGQQPPPYTAQAPMAPPPKKSGGALKIILIALGVIVVLFVVGIIGIGLFVKKTVLDNVSVKEGPGGKAEVSINTPGGQLKLSSKNDITEEKLGVPIYPGAKADEGAGSISFTGSDEKGSGTFGGASFTTTDSVDKVVDFYKSKLGSKVTVLDTTSEDKHSVVLSVGSEKSWKTITIQDEGNGITKIAVASLMGSTPQ